MLKRYLHQTKSMVVGHYDPQTQQMRPSEHAPSTVNPQPRPTSVFKSGPFTGFTPLRASDTPFDIERAYVIRTTRLGGQDADKNKDDPLFRAANLSRLLSKYDDERDTFGGSLFLDADVDGILELGESELTDVSFVRLLSYKMLIHTPSFRSSLLSKPTTTLLHPMAFSKPSRSRKGPGRMNRFENITCHILCAPGTHS